MPGQILNLLQPFFPTRSTSVSSWSERSFQLWPSLDLRLLFSFFAPVVLPRLLPLLASHVFVLRQIVLSLLTWSLGLVLLLMLWSLCQDHLADCFLLLESYRDGFTVTANFQWYSSRAWCRFPRIKNHLRHSTLRFQCTASKSCHSVFRSNAHLFFCHVRAKHLRAMLIPIC